VRDVEGRPEARLGRLPFTRREALDILALAGTQGSRRALDFDACLQAVRAPDLADFRLVHFATHGLLNKKRPELSGLVLSLTGPDGQSREGFLSVEEILSLRWRAELVTLSGCRTGLGRSVNGEGLVGLTRAFMVAGVPRVVASLWSVDDSATAELMRRFYAEMLGPAKRSPAAALRIAQLELRKKRSRAAPYYWAAFQLHGDWR
jgi:CHAT domain-containing protein